MQGIKRWLGAGVLTLALMGALVMVPHSTEASGFTIHGFYNWDGQYCTGLFNDRGQLQQYWGCYGGFSAMRAK